MSTAPWPAGGLPDERRHRIHAHRLARRRRAAAPPQLLLAAVGDTDALDERERRFLCSVAFNGGSAELASIIRKAATTPHPEPPRAGRPSRASPS